jgi:hypothetical protein
MFMSGYRNGVAAASQENNVCLLSAVADYLDAQVGYGFLTSSIERVRTHGCWRKTIHAAISGVCDQRYAQFYLVSEVNILLLIYDSGRLCGLGSSQGYHGAFAILSWQKSIFIVITDVSRF